jgi:hypothetical protein
MMIFISPVQFFLPMTRLKLTYVQHTYAVRMYVCQFSNFYFCCVYVQLKSQQIIRDNLVTFRLFQICLFPVTPLQSLGCCTSISFARNDFLTILQECCTVHVHSQNIPKLLILFQGVYERDQQLVDERMRYLIYASKPELVYSILYHYYEFDCWRC